MKKILSIIVMSLFFVATYAESNPLWMRYPSISPDGKTIVFSFKGDIYKVAANGGTATPLTTNAAYDFKPIWSPDGTEIAFASDRNGYFDIYVMPINGGKATRVTFHSGNETPNSYTPDGKNILFTASILDAPNNRMFPSGVISELYSVPAAGGRITQVLRTPAEEAKYNKGATKIIYQDRKGYENIWRKHHTSSVTKDVWIYDVASKKHTKLSDFNGEDREPSFGTDENTIYFLSEKFNSTFNVCKMSVDNPTQVTQLTKYDKNPVRFLSTANDGTLCYGYNGEIYTMKDGSAPSKVTIAINIDDSNGLTKYQVMRSGASEMTISPEGDEVAFIVHGEVYVTSVKYGTTRRITNTPEQERSVDFAPDGRAIVYAGERNGSWNLYQAKIVNKDEKKFTYATEIKEEALLTIAAETYQPFYSPDGKEVAYLEEREALKVINLATKKTRLVLDQKYNYSYSDGDQGFTWSPDSKWFLVDYSPQQVFSSEVGLIKADGSGEIRNLTNSGYNDGNAKFVLKGEAMIWFSDKQGYRSHGSWGSHSDVFIMFFTDDAHKKFTLNEEEYALYKERNKKDKKKDDDSDDKKKKKSDEKVTPSKDLKFNFTDIEDRIIRLTINSSRLSDAILSPDGDKLYYMSRFEKGYDLWVKDIRKNSTTLLKKLKGSGGGLQFDKSGKNLFFFSSGKFNKFETSSKKMTPVSYSAEFNWDNLGEKEYMFEHVWRQVTKKFYRKDLHGVDWDYMKTNYSRFLPYINNNYDYAEMLSEMLGELNASHTGSGYRHRASGADATAVLGAFYDQTFTGNGLKIVEVMDKSPLLKAKKEIKAGMIIEKVDGQTIQAGQDYYKLFNHKAGKMVVFGIYDPATKSRWNEVLKPISGRAQGQLLYERWVKWQRAETERLSGGKLGYIHVRGMNSASYRVVYSELLGRFFHKEAIIIDTRFNGGGWLHDDLANLLNGVKYAEFVPNEQYMGREPMTRWTKPSAVIMGESNYSDAHGFPFAYTALKIGKTVGMPVPGTMTAVWWETLLDKSVYFGIPQVGMKNMKGEYMENNQLEPDYKVANEYELIGNGRDQQLEKAVQVLLDQVKK